MPVPHAQQMVFRPDVIKKLTKQINGNKNVVDLCMRVKKIVLNLFVYKININVSLKKKRLWKLGQLIYEHFFFNISTTIIIHNIYRYIYTYITCWKLKRKKLNPKFERISGLKH